VRTAILEVGDDRFANTGRQRQVVKVSTFTSNAHLPGTPVQIVEPERRHLTRTKTEIGEQHHDRVIAALGRGTSMHRSQHLADGIWWNGSRDGRHRPTGHRRNRSRQIKRDVTAITCVLQERPQRGGKLLRLRDTQLPNLALDKSKDILGTKSRQARTLGAESICEERADEPDVTMNGPVRQPARLLKVSRKLAYLLLDWGQRLG
jgi:hypothetical protein